MMQTEEHPERFNAYQYPNFRAWHERMMEKESVKKCLGMGKEVGKSSESALAVVKKRRFAAIAALSPHETTVGSTSE